jgi:FkbM family methyltransferase
MNIFFQLRESELGRVGYELFRKLLPPLRVYRRVWGLKVFFDLRDCLFYLAMSRQELENLEGPVLEVLKRTDGPVWDVGCNVGLFSIYCASQGRPVTAFDISDKCIHLLQCSAAHNNLDIQTVPTALSIEPFEFVSPGSAHAMNAVSQNGSGIVKKSITLHEAEKQFGMPRLIKMDIEGAELDFFQSPVFKEWILVNRITLLVEIHSEKVWKAVWNDLPVEKLDDRHILISFDTINGM